MVAAEKFDPTSQVDWVESRDYWDHPSRDTWTRNGSAYKNKEENAFDPGLQQGSTMDRFDPRQCKCRQHLDEVNHYKVEDAFDSGVERVRNCLFSSPFHAGDGRNWWFHNEKSTSVFQDGIPSKRVSGWDLKSKKPRPQSQSSIPTGQEESLSGDRDWKSKQPGPKSQSSIPVGQEESVNSTQGRMKSRKEMSYKRTSLEATAGVNGTVHPCRPVPPCSCTGTREESSPKRQMGQENAVLNGRPMNIEDAAVIRPNSQLASRVGGPSSPELQQDSISSYSWTEEFLKACDQETRDPESRLSSWILGGGPCTKAEFMLWEKLGLRTHWHTDRARALWVQEEELKEDVRKRAWPDKCVYHCGKRGGQGRIATVFWVSFRV